MRQALRRNSWFPLPEEPKWRIEHRGASRLCRPEDSDGLPWIAVAQTLTRLTRQRETAWSVPGYRLNPGAAADWRFPRCRQREEECGAASGTLRLYPNTPAVPRNDGPAERQSEA